jgi:hypothetical protein
METISNLKVANYKVLDIFELFMQNRLSLALWSLSVQAIYNELVVITRISL